MLFAMERYHGFIILRFIFYWNIFVLRCGLASQNLKTIDQGVA